LAALRAGGEGASTRGFPTSIPAGISDTIALTMPSVFTIEGLSAAQLASLGDSRPDSQLPVIGYPQYGGPSAPYGVPIGPVRPPTLVFNSDKLAAMPGFVQFPDRGPITDYGDEYWRLLAMKPAVNLPTHLGLSADHDPKHRTHHKIMAGMLGLAVVAVGAGVGTMLGRRSLHGKAGR
jgi:hypothetical protein